MSRRPVEVVIARNGTLGPLHLAIPVAPGRWLAACRRTVRGPRVHTWRHDSPAHPWLEVRTCPACQALGARASSTTELARLAGWSR